MVDEAGEPHVMDFGLARRETDMTITLDGQVLGTPAYISPEQAAGRSHTADPRTDIYSLGVILFQLLTGQLPFRGDSRRLVDQAIHREAPSPRSLNSQLDHDLATLCLKCLEKEPARRYASAKALADDLGRYLRHEPILARPVGPWQRGWRWCKRNRTVASLLSLVFVTLLLGSIVSGFYAVKAANIANQLRSSLAISRIEEGRAVRALRSEGYRDRVFGLLRQARELDPTGTDLRQLRTEASLCLGDFVGLPTITHSDFAQPIATIALHPQSRWIAVGLTNGMIVLRDPKTGALRGELQMHAASVSALAFTADGESLVSVDQSGVAAVHQLTDQGKFERQSIQNLAPTAADVEVSAMLTRDGRRIVVSHNHQVAIWDIDPFALVSQYDAAELTIHAAVLSPDGKQLAAHYEAVDLETGLIVWDTAKHEVSQRIRTQLGSSYVGSINFSADSEVLAFGCDDGLVTFDARTWDRLQTMRRDAIKSVAFSADGQLLATVNIRGDIVVYSVSGGYEVARLTNPRRRGSSERLVFSDDGRLLASCNADQIRIWMTSATPERLTLRGHRQPIPCIQFTPDGQNVITGSKDGQIIWWNTANGQLLKPISSHRGKVETIACSGDGRLMVTAHWDDPAASLRLWDLSQRRELAIIPADLGDVNSVVLGTMGDFVAACGDEGLKLWAIEDGAVRDEPELDLRRRRCLCVVANRRGNLIAWVENEDQIRLWDREARRELPFNGPRMNQGWHGLAFFPDGERLAFVSHQNCIVVWNGRRNHEDRRLGSPQDFQSCKIALSDDGQWLAGLQNTSQIAIWNVATKERWALLSHEGSNVWSMDWDANGRRLAVGLVDGRAAIWDLDRAEAELQKFGLGW